MRDGLFKQEITPIANDDCFGIFERTKHEFDFPIHYHNEYELTCIKNGTELTRYVGNHIGKPSNWELVLIGPNLVHGWLHEAPLKITVYEKTLQFHSDLFGQQLLNRNAVAELNNLLAQAIHGILFSEDTAQDVFKRLHSLARSEGFESFTMFQNILQKLISDPKKQLLNNDTIGQQIDNCTNNRLYAYIQKNYHQSITLEEMSDLFNMSISSFNRMMKKQTGNTFVTFLNEYRLGMVARKLLETGFSVEYIAQSCGFHNISNFNKLFKRVYKMPPHQYREQLKGTASVK